VFFFFSSRRRHTRFKCDWSSDVCSSDLEGTVESVTDTTLTLKTASGQTIQVALNGSTTYHAQTDATASDVTTGGKVLVRLSGRGGFVGGNGGPAASGAPTSPTANDVTVVP